MKRISLLIIVGLAVLAAGAVYAAVELGSPFRVNWEKAPLELTPGQKFEATVVIHVPPGHFIYAEKTDVDFKSLEGVWIDEIVFPKTEKREDPYFGKSMEVFTGDVPITIVGHIPEVFSAGERELVAVLSFQGCSPKLCLRPEEYDIAFRINVLAAPGEVPTEAREAAARLPKPAGKGMRISSLLKAADFGLIMDRGVALTVLIVFLAGILISLTPCIWPIIPVVLLIIGVESEKKWWRNISLAATLVGGIIVVNTALGLIAVALGKNLGFLFQQRWFLALVVLFFVAMSLAMFGLFEFAPLKRFQQKLSRLGGKGYKGALLAGGGVGLIASPCASPVLVALLGYVTLKQSYLLGAGLLLVFGIGMGLFFIVIGAAYGTLAGHLKGGRWMVRAKRVLGILLLLPAIFYLRSIVRWDGAFEPAKDEGRPRIEWVTSYQEGLSLAGNEGRPVMMEFYADWCPPCRALESKFFRRDDIIKLSYQLVPVRVDSTVENKQVEEAVEKYKVIGWPTILFLSPKGEVYPDLTVISYDPQKIENNMREAIARARSQS